MYGRHKRTPYVEVVVYLGLKGISHTKSFKCGRLLNEQSDGEFVQPVDK